MVSPTSGVFCREFEDENGPADGNLAVAPIFDCEIQFAGRSRQFVPWDGIVTEFVFSRPTSNLSSGFVGTVICGAVGIGLATAAVAFAVAGGFMTKLFGLSGLLVAGMICGFARTASPWWKLRLTAFFISCGVMLLVAEGLLRLLTHFPVNTSSNMVPHPQLGYVLDSRLSDVDDNGFRNPQVPETADIIAIGDSHTQGINVDSDTSWPQLLGGQSGQSVYNMGVGGYGPLQYHALIPQALQMHPQQIIIGLYLGNDIGDVARGIRNRHSEMEIDNSFRHYIKYHTAIGSAVTQLIKRSPLGRPPGFEVSHLVNPTFVANDRLHFLAGDMDLSDPEIADGFRKTIVVLSAAQQKCEQQQVRLTVILIPTRESVYFNSKQNPQRSWPSEFKQLAHRESELRKQLQAALTNQHVAYVDVLPLLVTAVDSKSAVYAAHDEGHPLAEGYSVYAQAVANAAGVAVGAK